MRIYFSGRELTYFKQLLEVAKIDIKDINYNDEKKMVEIDPVKASNHFINLKDWLSHNIMGSTAKKVFHKKTEEIIKSLFS